VKLLPGTVSQIRHHIGGMVDNVAEQAAEAAFEYLVNGGDLTQATKDSMADSILITILLVLHTEEGIES